ncbi:MGDG synthase family glycosyltransferase [Ectobacillus panaciterrae]|uniref:MGDG synthase family glycosyltransferase n=1 Tax=Ectobacillus panaciterrae TaxID=363872 RepID=UPI000421541F|nr:glycosyltransferase [Ectobacillus panaciterrae]
MKPSRRDKILILSSTFGEGHQQAAYAIHEATQLRQPVMESVVLDFMAWAHPYLYPASHYLYMKGIQIFPAIYDYLYQKTRRRNSFSMSLKTILSLEKGQMLKLLQEVQPSVVVSTFPYPAAIMSKLKEYGLTTVPTVTIITDYTDHSYWIHPYTDQYIVGSSLIRQALHRQGIPDDKITDTGIPIKAAFSNFHSSERLAMKYGLDSKVPTILVMGGGYGMMGDGLSIFQVLNELPEPIQILIVCGHNEKLRHQVREGLKHSKHRIHLAGYIDYVHELMAVSNLIITKAGGITTSEALAMGLPMLLYNPLPGQEQDNARFLVQSGVAVQAENLTDLRTKLSNMLCNPKFLSNMKENANRFHAKAATAAALDVIVRASHQEPSPIAKLAQDRPIKFQS